MGLFSKKEPYQYKVLERYKIDIEKPISYFSPDKLTPKAGKVESSVNWLHRIICISFMVTGLTLTIAEDIFSDKKRKNPKMSFSLEITNS